MKASIKDFTVFFDSKKESEVNPLTDQVFLNFKDTYPEYEDYVLVFTKENMPGLKSKLQSVLGSSINTEPAINARYQEVLQVPFKVFRFFGKDAENPIKFAKEQTDKEGFARLFKLPFSKSKEEVVEDTSSNYGPAVDLEDENAEEVPLVEDNKEVISEESTDTSLVETEVEEKEVELETAVEEKQVIVEEESISSVLVEEKIAPTLIEEEEVIVTLTEERLPDVSIDEVLIPVLVEEKEEVLHPSLSELDDMIKKEHKQESSVTFNDLLGIKGEVAVAVEQVSEETVTTPVKGVTSLRNKQPEVEFTLVHNKVREEKSEDMDVSLVQTGGLDLTNMESFTALVKAVATTLNTSNIEAIDSDDLNLFIKQLNKRDAHIVRLLLIHVLRTYWSSGEKGLVSKLVSDLLDANEFVKEVGALGEK